ncbi:MAG: hypothetical protein ACKVSF_05485 [Alphaproteobacteria bacterium]
MMNWIFKTALPVGFAGMALALGLGLGAPSFADSRADSKGSTISPPGSNASNPAMTSTSFSSFESGALSAFMLILLGEDDVQPDQASNFAAMMLNSRALFGPPASTATAATFDPAPTPTPMDIGEGGAATGTIM